MRSTHIAIDPQSRTIEITSLLPGKLFRAVIYPTTIAGKESVIPYKNSNLRSTCGCPVDDATLRQTEPTGKPSDVVLAQVRMDVCAARGVFDCKTFCSAYIFFETFFNLFALLLLETRQDLLELD
jgi:hypothetical protein